MIRNVVIHMNNEQPLVADLFEMPDSGDGLLRCTNLRTLGGKRPVFADEMASTFYFPYLNIRFLEFTPRTLGGPDQPATTDVIAVSADMRLMRALRKMTSPISAIRNPQ